MCYGTPCRKLACVDAVTAQPSEPRTTTSMVGVPSVSTVCCASISKSSLRLKLRALSTQSAIFSSLYFGTYASRRTRPQSYLVYFLPNRTSPLSNLYRQSVMPLCNSSSYTSTGIARLIKIALPRRKTRLVMLPILHKLSQSSLLIHLYALSSPSYCSLGAQY